MNKEILNEVLGDMQKKAPEGSQPAQNNFKLLPGDPFRGTLYKGFISKVYQKEVEGENAANLGEDLLVVHLQVTDGEYQGKEEVINRVLTPKRLQNPPSNDEERAYWLKEAQKSNPPLKNDDEGRIQAENAWREAVKRYYKKTLEQFIAMGVDVSSGDEAKMFAQAAHATGNPVAWKIYDANGTKPRRVYFEDPAKHFPKKDKESANAEQPSLPDGSDIPID